MYIYIYGILIIKGFNSPYPSVYFNISKYSLCIRFIKKGLYFVKPLFFIA